MDFSAAMPMSTLSADDPTVDETKQKAELGKIKEEEFLHDTSVTPISLESASIVQVASGSDTHNASGQEVDGGEFFM